MGVCTLPMVPCGSSPVTRFALASAMRKTKRLRTEEAGTRTHAVGRHFNETVPMGNNRNITWSEIEEHNIQAKKVYRPCNRQKTTTFNSELHGDVTCQTHVR